MKRRDFFKLAIGAAAAAVVLPEVAAAEPVYLNIVEAAPPSLDLYAAAVQAEMKRSIRRFRQQRSDTLRGFSSRSQNKPLAIPNKKA